MNIIKLIGALIVALTAIASVSAWSFSYSGYSSSPMPFTGTWASTYTEPGYGQYSIADNHGQVYGGYNSRSGNTWNGATFNYGVTGYDNNGNANYGLLSASANNAGVYGNVYKQFDGTYGGTFSLGSRGVTAYPYYYNSNGYGYTPNYGNYMYGSGQYEHPGY